ncbi:MAG TPA: hypothetical protein PKA41_17630, partial [Verrucomicrobiota bacterium]|nr:hypothetical protein [Verrucomicrobiota bacterium]
MPEAPQNSELLRSLGRLVRGLSALFWGLPAALIICVSTAKTEFLRPTGIIPAIAAMGLLYFGLWQIGKFHPQERPWRVALDRARIAALANLFADAMREALADVVDRVAALADFSASGRSDDAHWPLHEGAARHVLRAADQLARL